MRIQNTKGPKKTRRGRRKENWNLLLLLPSSPSHLQFMKAMFANNIYYNDDFGDVDDRDDEDGFG